MAISRRLFVAWLLGTRMHTGARGAAQAVVIALDGAIGPGSANYVVRSLNEAQRQDAAVVVLRMDTPGGLDSAMRDIIRAMLASPVPVLAYVAPSGARAASAGTFILYAAALAAMAPGTNLGAASPVSLFAPMPLAGSDAKPADDGGKADQPAKATPRDAELTKVTNDAVAYIRGLATLHVRNADWAEKAVREAVSLPYDAALEQHVIDLVAADLPDLLAKANGRSVIVQGKPVLLDTSGLAIAEVAPGLRDRLLALLTDPSIVYLLLLAGLFGIAFEASHPGIYAPGVIGVICAAGRRLRPQSAADRLCRAGAGAARPGADGRRGVRAVVRRFRAWRHERVRDRIAADVRGARRAVAAGGDRRRRAGQRRAVRTGAGAAGARAPPPGGERHRRAGRLAGTDDHWLDRPAGRGDGAG